MRNTPPVKPWRCAGPRVAVLAAALCALTTIIPGAGAANPIKEKPSVRTETALSAKQQAIGPIAAFAATGDMTRLHAALDQGLDAGLTVGDCKEILVQLYAYAGFPRSLNALNEFMKVLAQREQRGIVDQPGGDSEPVPVGDELLAAGTANQTKLVGVAVSGPLFDFAPAIDRYLKTHLFGDIFARTNLDWQSRELATVATLAAMTGVESQLQSHLAISMNVGIAERQLRQFIETLAARVDADAGRRALAALDKQLAAAKP